MKTLSQSTFDALTHGAESLSHDVIKGVISHKVLRLRDQSMLKLFRVKHLISSARLIPYASRFRKNAARLATLDIPTVRVTAVYRIPSIDRTAVHYQPLEGMTLRDHGADHTIDVALASRLGAFFCNLHRQGVYFRSIHFGNIVLTPGGRIGLIDIADMRFHRRPLNTPRRIRNLRHFFRYRVDAEMLAPASHPFLESYCREARLSRRDDFRFRKHFKGYLKTI